MNNKLFLIIGLFALCISCSPSIEENKNEKIVIFDEKDLPPAIALKGKKYNFTEFLDPKRILCVGDFLVVSEKSNGDLLHILDMKSEKHIRSTGKNGFGPGEATMAWTLERGAENGSFWTYDLEQKIASMYAINDTSKLAQKQLRLGEIFYYIMEMTWASDTSIMASMVDGNDKYFEISLQGDTLATYGTWDSMIDRKDIPFNVISSIHQGSIKASPDKSKFIIAGRLRDYIDVLDKSSGKILSIRGPINEIPEFEVDYSQGYPMASIISSRRIYFGSYAGKSLIYALYVGKDYKQISNPDKLNKVFVFDYQGNIQNNYELDYQLSEFTVDEDNGIIYGLTVDAEPNVVAFKIPD
ncbi:BF3164 family lipoprotein [uncultured Cyclobacterium sp.]|uniref:BF3164 family lipoprotein n=1 Tax=uncultured Cyclobacterium sp. TaxID=453820 RepID=UPI0030ECB61E